MHYSRQPAPHVQWSQGGFWWARLRKLGIDMKRVVVAAQPIEVCLVLGDPFLDFHIGCSLR